MLRRTSRRASIVLLATALLLPAQEFDIAGDQAWLDTGIQVAPGDALHISGAGTIQFSQAPPNGPEGLARGWKDLTRNLPVNDAGRGALIGRIGDRDTSRVFLIGPSKDARAVVAGRLFLFVNRASNDSAQGSFHVSVSLTRASPNAPGPSITSNARLPRITQAILDRIPTRVTDADGNPGDRVDFLMIGSEDAMQKAFQEAGWVKVDRSVKDAVLHGIFSSLSKAPYLEMPMSELYLYNRPQDYGFAHAEPIKVAESRHHLRLWKAPLQADGETIWVGAATHDIGFERDQRNGKITHKIDPNVDLEREYVGQTINETGMVGKLSYMTATYPVKDARTATGGGFHSDGRTLILILAPSAAAENGRFDAAFSDLFASVLQSENPDAGQWGAASQFLETPPTGGVALGPLSNRYRVLVVPGFMNACASFAPAYQEARKHLHDRHTIDIDLLSTPNDTSENNARLIVDYLRSKSQTDRRKFIVIGYSKGVPDLQIALQDPAAASTVAAFVSVAGAIGGSPLADAMPGQMAGLFSMLPKVDCAGDVSAAVSSLRRDVRKTFLAAHPDPPVPSYSLVAVSDRDTTSRFLMQTWLMLSVYDSREDGQLLAKDGILPGAKYLGAARADHIAVALSLDRVKGAGMMVDHARYPRAALLESLIRFVIQDLGG